MRPNENLGLAIALSMPQLITGYAVEALPGMASNDMDSFGTAQAGSEMNFDPVLPVQTSPPSFVSIQDVNVGTNFGTMVDDGLTLTYTASGGNLVQGSATLYAGGPPVTVDGEPVSFGADGIVAGSKTFGFAPGFTSPEVIIVTLTGEASTATAASTPTSLSVQTSLPTPPVTVQPPVVPLPTSPLPAPSPRPPIMSSPASVPSMSTAPMSKSTPASLPLMSKSTSTSAPLMSKSTSTSASLMSTSTTSASAPVMSKSATTTAVGPSTTLTLLTTAKSTEVMPNSRAGTLASSPTSSRRTGASKTSTAVPFANNARTPLVDYTALTSIALLTGIALASWI